MRTIAGICLQHLANSDFMARHKVVTSDTLFSDVVAQVFVVVNLLTPKTRDTCQLDKRLYILPRSLLYAH